MLSGLHCAVLHDFSVLYKLVLSPLALALAWPWPWPFGCTAGRTPP